MNNQLATRPLSRRISLAMAVIVFLLAVMGVGGAAPTPDEPAIIGGREADPGEWPWQVALIHYDGHPYWDQFCGGSLIDPLWVVTAAHCVDGSGPGELQVLAGIHNLKAPDSGYLRLNIAEIAVHPQYGQHSQYDSDIALLRLATPAGFRLPGGDTLPVSGISPVPSNIGPLAGASSTITGWGNRNAVVSDFPSTLHEVDIPITTQAECEAAYPFFLTDNMLCAGIPEGGRDSCQGDSGGPLMVYNNVSALWELAGIVSWGHSCALPGFPGVYTRVSRFQEWISEETGIMSEPDFIFSLSPTTANVCAGTPVSLTVGVAPRGGFTGRVQLALAGLPWGGVGRFDPTSLMPPARGLLSIDTTGLAEGDHILLVRGTSNGLVREAGFNLSVSPHLPERPQLMEPELGVASSSATPTFRWSAVHGARSYRLEVASDSAFNDVVYTAQVNRTSHTLPDRLAPQAQYYWRVRADNACGAGPFSTVFSLTTVQAHCRAVDLFIPDHEPTGVSDELTLSDTSTLKDIDIYLNIRHTWVSDLKAQLTHVPSGRVVTLFERPALQGPECESSRQDMVVTLNDEAPHAIGETCYDDPPIFRGNVAPQERLDAFVGLSPAGSWRLHVSDLAMVDIGHLVEWCLMPASGASFCDSVTDVPAAECATLQSIFGATNGWLWEQNDGWFVSPAACDWFGVDCQAGHVTGVRLAGNELDGLLPPAVGNLSHLQTLDVSGNAALVGPLPEPLMRLALDRLWYDDTGLCTPTRPEFASWLQGVGDLRQPDALCGQQFMPVTRR